MYVCMICHSRGASWAFFPFLGITFCNTAILVIIEALETAFNGFYLYYQFTTGKPLKNLKVTLKYYENGSM